MKHLFPLFSLCCSVLSANAQYLVKDDYWTREQICEDYSDVETAVIYENRFGITGQNYIKGNALAEKWFQGAGLTAPDEVAGLVIRFYEKTDFGYYAVFDEKDYNITEPKTVLVVYNDQKNVIHQYLLSDAFANGRVKDFRYDGGHFFLALGDENKKTEFGYYSYQLFCFDTQADRIVWRTDFEVCSQQFDVIRDYVVTGFGGTGIKDYLCLIDRSTGVTLDRAPMPTAPQYIEAVRTQDTIYVEDYNSNVYRYLIKDRCVEVRGRGVRLRRGPSTSDEIFADQKGKPIYPSYGDHLAYLGESGDFYKVRFNQQELYISKRFAKYVEGMPEKQHLISLWQAAMKSQDYVIAAPVSTMCLDIDGDGIEERITKDFNDQMAVFTVKGQQYRLICTDILGQLRVYPKFGVVHTYSSLATGFVSESLYFLKDSELHETWKCVNDDCTKAFGQDKPSFAKTTEYYSKRLLLDKSTPEDFFSSFDL